MASDISPSAGLARIVLIGFMGAGKSTVGALLATGLGWTFRDADAELEQRTGTTIAEIFTQQGEAAFRRLEAEIIRDLLNEQNLVLAVGGGAVETEAIREELLKFPQTCVIFLEAPLSVAIARCEQQAGGAVRPVLMDRERLSGRFESRLPHYRKAHLTIDTALFSPEETARSIIESTGLSRKTTKETNPA